MIYHFKNKHANHYERVDCGFIGGVMVNVFILKAVDRGFIGGVMVSVLVSKAVDHGFIGGGLAFLSRKQETRTLTRHR
jgi:hypothetical protein